MIYFDNAATGGFKPHAVTQNVETVLKFLSANPGRSGHRLSVTGAEIVYNCRAALSELFNCSAERVVFTKNCTEALNLAIFGSLKKGGHVITTVYEHNSVLRPLFHLKEAGLIELSVVSDGEDFLPNAIEKEIKSNTYLIVSNSVSNVTGYELPVKEIGEIAKKYQLLFILDGAQGAGHIPIDMKALNVSALAVAGHKGLYGIMGSGALLFSENLELSPLLFGGTGSETFKISMPDGYPERLEAGTLNLPAIAGLLEGVRYVKNNLSTISDVLLNYTSRLYGQVSLLENVQVFSRPNRTGIFSFRINGMPSSEVSDLLNSEYDVAVRGGLHCAPLLHKKLNTAGDGLVRASLAPQNTVKEIDYLVKAVANLAKT